MSGGDVSAVYHFGREEVRLPADESIGEAARRWVERTRARFRAEDLHARAAAALRAVDPFYWPTPKEDRMDSTSNPHGEAMAVDGAAPRRSRNVRDVLYERARGVEVEDFDAIARGRWIEGYDAGHEDGIAEESMKHREFLETGQRSGAAGEHRETAERYGERLHLAHQLALALADDTGHGDEAHREAFRVVGAVLGTVIDEHNRGPDGPRTKPEPMPDGCGLFAEPLRRLSPEDPEAKQAVRERLLAQLGRWVPEG